MRRAGAPKKTIVVDTLEISWRIAKVTAPTSIIGKIAPPVLRYIGSVADADGKMVYYIKDESRGRLLRIGKGVNDGDIEFIGATKDSVTVKVAGNELSVRR